MEKAYHFLSEDSIWESVSEFVDSQGQIIKGTGESVIKTDRDLITNDSWSTFDGKKIYNNYQIKHLSGNRYQYTSQNPALGIQSGFFDISKSIIFSKFSVRDTKLNGYEIIRRIDNMCYANGALYNGNELINTWISTLQKKDIKSI